MQSSATLTVRFFGIDVDKAGFAMKLYRRFFNVARCYPFMIGTEDDKVDEAVEVLQT